MTHHLENLKRLAGLQNDTTIGPWLFEDEQNGNEHVRAVGLIKTIANINVELMSLETDLSNGEFIAQSGSTDFAAIAEYVERLEKALAVIDALPGMLEGMKYEQQFIDERSSYRPEDVALLRVYNTALDAVAEAIAIRWEKSHD